MKTNLTSRAGKMMFAAGCLWIVLSVQLMLQAAVLRTMVHHQVTSFPYPGLASMNHSLAISADGNKIAFARPYYGGPSRSNLIYTVNFDGTDLRLVDMYAVGNSMPQVDISANGSNVISWESGLLRMVGADGSNPRELIQVNGGYPDFRISPDGTKVFFSDCGYFSTTPDTGTREPGIYVINADGTGLREVAGVTSFALFFGLNTSQLLPEGYMYGWNGGQPFGVSGDELKLVCYVWTPTNGYRLVGVNLDGSDMHEFVMTPTPIQGYKKVGLSWDGSKVYYYMSYAPCCSSGEELGVFNWNGSGRRVLLSNYSTNQSSAGYDVGEITMSRDGSKLLFGQSSWLFNTDGSMRLQLSGPQGYTELTKWGFYHGVMSSNALRFSYLAAMPDGGMLQVGTMEINPPSLGLAPYITNAAATPEFIVTNGLTWTFLTASAPSNLYYGFVSVMGYLNGMPDNQVQNQYLVDNGSSGDQHAADGVYSGWMNSGSQAVVGPRTLRFKNEWQAVDSKYHATIVEITPFFVTTGTPTNPPPAVTSVYPPNVAAGSTVTISGSGFDPIATNNIVLFGNYQAQVISVNPACTQIVVVVPPDIPIGTVPLTVSSLGQSSAPVNYNVPDPYASTILVKMLAGLEITGKIGASYRIDYLTNISDTNSWAPLVTNTLTSSPLFWPDVSSTNQPQRYYRSVRVTP